MDDKMDMRASIKVENGSINGQSTYIWIEVDVIRKIDNYQYVARGVDGNDELFYLKPEEIHCSLYDFKLYFDERF
jgi:hypothetical protein